MTLTIPATSLAYFRKGRPAVSGLPSAAPFRNGNAVSGIQALALSLAGAVRSAATALAGGGTFLFPAGAGVSFFSATPSGGQTRTGNDDRTGTSDDREKLNRETEALLDKFRNAILSFAYTYVASLEDAEDILQDTMIAYMVNRPVFENDAHAKAWLMKTARNLCLNRLRYNRYRRHEVIDEVMEETLAAPETEKIPEVLEAVRKLPDNMSEAIYLFYWEGYSTAQIARILGRRETTVRSDMSRARARLKNILREEFDFG